MCKVFLFQRSLEAKGGPILSLIFGDGGAGFGWIGSTKKAMTHGPRHYEVASSGIPGKVVLSEIETTIRHSMLSRPVCSNFLQVLVSKKVIAAMPKRQGAPRRVFCKSF
jgi:hypothetical protein